MYDIIDPNWYLNSEGDGAGLSVTQIDSINLSNGLENAIIFEPYNPNDIRWKDSNIYGEGPSGTQSEDVYINHEGETQEGSDNMSYYSESNWGPS